jgi:hypothetical protein
VFPLFDATQHIATNFTVTIDGDQATARANFQAAHVPRGDDSGTHSDVGGVYEFTLRKSDGSWRIALLTQQFVWLLGRPILDYLSAETAS